MSAEKELLRAVRVTPSGLDLDGEVLPLLAGEVHYYHHRPNRWAPLLDGLCDLGLTCVATYVPWGVHDLGEDRYDFGERDPRLDLDRFIELAKARGLRVVLRPGPHINAELTWLGYPQRVIGDEQVMARTPAGNPVWIPVNPRPMPVPSYASTRFLEAVDQWLAEVGTRVEAHQWPQGPVVAVQLDNEAPLLFRNGPFDQDYHPEVIASYREYTSERGRGQPSAPTSLEAATPVGLLPVIDWIACKNEVFASALRRMREVLEGAGLRRVAFTHNLAQTGAVPDVAPSTFDAADLVGIDLYHLRPAMGLIRDRCLYAVGSTRLPFAAELGVGGPWNLPARSPDDSIEQARAVVAYGLRAFDLFMTADRDRYYGAPLHERAEAPRDPVADGLRELISTFTQYELNELKLRAPVAIVVPRCYPTMTHATWTLGPFGPPVLQVLGLTAADGASEDSFGFSRPIQIAWFEDLRRLTRALRRAGVGYVIVDGEGVEERLGELEPQVVVALTYEVIEQRLWNLLLDRAGASLEIVIGPLVPTLDHEMASLDRALSLEGRCESGLRRLSVDDDGACRDFASELAGRPELGPLVWADAEHVDVTVLEGSGKTRVVWVVETGGSRREVTLRARPGLELMGRDRDPLAAGTVELTPWSVRFFLLVGDEGVAG